MVIQVFINFYGEINIVMLFLKTASKSFMPGNLGVILSPINDCPYPFGLFTEDTKVDHHQRFFRGLDDKWTFRTDAELASAGEYAVYFLKLISVNFDLHMDASQLPMSPRCEFFVWTGVQRTYLIKMFPHILKRGPGDYRRLLHVVGLSCSQQRLQTQCLKRHIKKRKKDNPPPHSPQKAESAYLIRFWKRGCSLERSRIGAIDVWNRTKFQSLNYMTGLDIRVYIWSCLWL